MRNSVGIVMVIFVVSILTGCYNKPSNTHDAYVELNEHTLDSLSFQSFHHYTNNYNFLVNADSLVLLSQQPEEVISDFDVDTFAVYRDEHLVVAEIRFIPNDTVDSVWIQLANNKARFGWIHESELLPKVVPDDPISQFISIFSDTHILIFVIFLILMASVYVIVKIRKNDVPFVHLRDIDTFYPALLCIIVASSATLYASIQMFVPDMWRHFYYHPTLNPFSVPFPLTLFLASVWAMLIVGIAVVDDVFKLLNVGNGILYLGGVFAVCSVNYVLFSISTLYYIGYPLLVVYIYISIRMYLRYNFKPFICGNCGSTMRRKGRCKHCGTLNS